MTKPLSQWLELGWESVYFRMVLHRVPPNVRILKLEGENYRTIGIAVTSLKTLAPATKKFIEYLKVWLSE